jgi:formate dehydrogenase major subunit
VILASVEDEGKFGDRVILKTEYGETAVLSVKYSDKIKPRTLFTTFHHAKSKINAIFGDEADELIMTARFKSLRVNVIPQ